MTTLTQSELDDMRRGAEEYPGLYHDVLALLDHIAQLTAERDEAKDRRWFWDVFDKTGMGGFSSDEATALRELIDGWLNRQARVAELEAQLSPLEPGTAPQNGWTCFHCGEHFGPYVLGQVRARAHFGACQDAIPACQIKGADERGLLYALRRAEEELERYRVDDSDKDREIHGLIADHAVALRREEEKGYEKGVKDAKLEAQSSAQFVAGMRVLERLVRLQKDIQADVSTAHRLRGSGASEWMREDDREMRSELDAAFNAASAILAEAVMKGDGTGMEKGAPAKVPLVINNKEETPPPKL